MREDLSSGRASPFDLRAQPFWLLRIVPTSTRHEIEDAFEFAMRRQAASAEMLAHARDVLIDASLRLPYELAYPLGHPISELDEWHHLTSSDARSDELIKYAKRLSILSRFNFFAFVAAHRAADTKFLCAIIEAYSQIEPVEIYEELREIRRIGHYAAPSLASVREALEVQLDNYCQAIVAAYGQIEDLAEAIFGCVQQTLAKDDPHRMKVLSHLLAPYQSAVMAEQALMAEDIRATCDDIEEHPDDEGSIGALTSMLERWMALHRPLIVFARDAGRSEESFAIIAERLRSLVIDLALRQRYETAMEIAKLCNDNLSMMPWVMKLLDEAVVPAKRGLHQLKTRKLAALMSLVDTIAHNPAPLIEALKGGRFGPDGKGVANQLWQTFAETITATRDREFVEPWTEIRTLAKYLTNQPGGVAVAVAILQDLRDQLPQISAPIWVAEGLRDDLRQLTRPATKFEPQPKTAGRTRRFYIAGAILTASCAALILFGLEQSRLVLNDTFARTSPAKPTASSSEDGGIETAREEKARGEETAPAVGSRKQLTLSNLRYCRFQEERLRLIKPKVQSAEDIRAFNMLAVDYNSRCSDFLYRDGDAATVAAEMNSNRDRLAAEADQIVVAWRGRAAQGGSTK